MEICPLSCCAWLVWVFSMVQRVPTAGLCPRILFCIVTRSLACFWRALGCCVRKFTTLAVSAFVCPCPKLQYAWDSFWQFPLATLCTGDTQDHWSCNPHQADPQKTIQGSMRNMQGTMRICWLFGLPSTQKLCTNQPHVLCPCSNLSACCDPFSSKAFSVRNQATNGKKRHLLHLLLLIYMNCQDDHNTMRTIQQLDLSRLWPLQWSGTVGKGPPFWNAVIESIESAFPASKHLKSLELLKHAQLACHCAGFHDPGPRWNHRSSTYLANTLALHFPEQCPIVCISATFSNIDDGLQAHSQQLCLGRHSCHHSFSNYHERETVADQNRIPQRTNWPFELLRMTRLSIQHGATFCPRILFCIVTRGLACFWRALGCCVKCSQRWQYLLSSAHVPSYSMLGILSDTSPSQRTVQHAHKITEAALIKQLRKRTYREAWGTCKEPWGFAGSLGCLQRRSLAPTNLMYFVHVPISQHAVTRSLQKPWLLLVQHAFEQASSLIFFE